MSETGPSDSFDDSRVGHFDFEHSDFVLPIYESHLAGMAGLGQFSPAELVNVLPRGEKEVVCFFKKQAIIK